jgi:CubicO group peptidase (beta-lactamase class C family)
VPAAYQATVEKGKIMNNIQQQVQQAIDQLVESGAERGLQVAVYRHGQQVVDAVAGVADPATGRADGGVV